MLLLHPRHVRNALLIGDPVDAAGSIGRHRDDEGAEGVPGDALDVVFVVAQDGGLGGAGRGVLGGEIELPQDGGLVDGARDEGRLVRRPAEVVDVLKVASAGGGRRGGGNRLDFIHEAI